MSQSRRLLGVVMDPIDTIKPKKDSTLAMLLAAQRRGWDIVYFRQQDLEVRDGAPQGPRVAAYGARRQRAVVRDRDPVERRARAARCLADAQGSAVRHGVHLHDVHPRARREPRAPRRQQAREPPGHQRKGLHVLVPAVHAAELGHAFAHGPARVLEGARQSRAEAVRRHGWSLGLHRDRRRSQHQRHHRDAHGQRRAIHARAALHPGDRQRRQARAC